MATDLDAIAARLFASVTAPLVLAGAIRPGHAIGARAALSLGDGRPPADRELADRVAAARVRRARRLLPIDALPDPNGADWALSAAFHDILQAANPIFDAPLRRGSAARILDLAVATIARVPEPASVGEALSRHTWLSRIPDVTRTDTDITWWAGARQFRGVDPPERLQAWPHLRRVSVDRTAHRLLDLAPLAVDRERLESAVAALLSRTPLTDLATCSRIAPIFAWRRSTLGMIATSAGRTLAVRSLAGAAQHEVDASLGRATRELLARGHGHLAAHALALLADRAMLEVADPFGLHGARSSSVGATLAQALGALAATRTLTAGDGSWSAPERARLVDALAQREQSPQWIEARRLLESY
jgi:hypothetical protein